MIDPLQLDIPISHQCELLGVSRSGYYYEPKPQSPERVALLNRIDEIYTAFPCYGSPRITAQLRRDGVTVNHKAVELAMREMGLAGLTPRKNTSSPHPDHAKYPYLLKELKIVRPNQVWGTDITYVRANGLWFYLVAILDWYSRYVLSWKLSQAMTAQFCVAALTDALAIAQPEIHNSDQGSQFTSAEYLTVLQAGNIQISMDGQGRCFDNIFTERLWRTVKYEEVYLRDYRSQTEASESLDLFFRQYNQQRLHQSLNYRTPAEVYWNKPYQPNQLTKVEKLSIV